MKNTLLISLAVIIVLAGGVYLYSSTNSQSEVDSTVMPKPTQSTEKTVPTSADITTINMDAGSFYYSVKEIKAKVGDRIKIVITSKDMMHDLNIDELKVKSAVVKSGETTTVEFTADQAGTFEYYCSVGQHRKNGQVGKLIVE